MNYIQQHLAENATLTFIRRILQDYLADDMVELYGIVDDYTVGSGDVIGGIYLPAPTMFEIQSGPTSELFKDVGFIASFIGPTGAIQKVGGANTIRLDLGYVYQIEQTFAVTTVFGVAPQLELSLGGAIQREESILRLRASYYAGALAHTIAKRAYGSEACRGTVPVARSSDQSELRIAADQYSLFAIAAYEFTVFNTQLFPATG